MGKEKAGFLTPKAISNRIKSKGLQKLRWYCQMCQKQCRDENGFKCHTTSESHQRQLLLVADNPGKFVNTFSKDFSDQFIELLRRRFGTKRVHGNVVYQEYISDREHIHMNSTQWTTLTGYVKWMGKEGLCMVDETPKGWFITYIDRSPEAIRRQEAKNRKDRMDLDDEELRQKVVTDQIERDKQNMRDRNGEGGGGEDDVRGGPTDLIKMSDEEKVVFKIPAMLDKHKEKDNNNNINGNNNNNNDIKNAINSINNKHKLKSLFPSSSSSHKRKHKAEDDDASSVCSHKSTSSTSSSNGRKKKSALDEIMQMEESKKAKFGRKDHWLMEGIVVKVTTNKVGKEFYKKKAVVKEVIDKYGGVIRILGDGDEGGGAKLKLDQLHLETVLPAIGKRVMVVNGGYRGNTATLDSIDEKQFCCNITIDQGALRGRAVAGVLYEDVCKLLLS